ncbi:MAG: peptidoglycan DD-metalloendopeptidase family protein [Gemmatimonadetes bacterium]|nr:peptidoglycan DD-metalloendopeptidase family protein [Gemmatimonadota bacterium]
MGGTFLYIALWTLNPELGAVTAFAQTPTQRRLEQIRQERGALTTEAKEMEARARALTSDMRSVDRQVGSSAAALDALRDQVGERNAQVTQTERDLMVTRDRLGDRRAVLHARLRSIYKRGPLNAVQVLLTADSFGELINRYKYLFLIARHDRQLVKEVAMLEAQLASRERLLHRSLNQLQDEQTERSMMRDELAELRSAQQRVLSTVASRQQAAARRLARLDADERSLRGLLADLERTRVAPAAAGAAPRPADTSTLTAGDLGTLAWPVQGELLYRFGPATQSNGTSIRWNGVGIGAAAGSHVRAVEGGTVVMAGPFEGYGPSVVLSHGGGYYSLYLYLQRVGVRTGDTVGRNELLGTVGGTATPEGPHMEFQIRGPGGEAVDPLAWLRSRSGG